MTRSRSGEAPAGGAITLSHYLLLGLLTLLNVLNIVDRQLLSSFANFIVPDLGLTNTQFGLLTGLMFMVFYSFLFHCRSVQYPDGQRGRCRYVCHGKR